MVTINILDVNLEITKTVKFGVYNIHNIAKKGGDDIIFDTDIVFDDEDLIVDEKPELETPDVDTLTENIIVNLDDNILDLRRKIQVATGIPLYRQHLYYIVNDKATPLSYKVLTNIVQKIDIRDTLSLTDKVNDIPVNTKTPTSGYIIESFEEFRLVRNLPTYNLYLVDLDNYFQNKVEYESHMSDLYTVNLLYYSFVIRYWPMMTIDVFVQYVKNESEIASRYPLLHPNNDEINQKITSESAINTYKDTSAIDKNIMIGITHATIHQTGKSEVNLRNLFDKFQLSNKTPYIKCKCQINGSPVELHKNYKGANITREKHNNNSLLIHVIVKLPNELYTTASLVINTIGHYYVTSTWRDDFYIDFVKLYKIISDEINPIITYINSLGKYVSNKPFVKINEWTSKIKDMSMSIYWKQTVNTSTFNKIITALRGLVEGGIISPRQTLGAINEYTFNKGMHKFNHTLIEDLVKGINNYYTRLTDGNVRQKWKGLFEKSRIFKVHHRYADVKFDIFNIKEEEKDIVLHYVQQLLSNIKIVDDNKTAKTDVDKKLKKLKEMDPELYDFKKAYQSGEILSKKCQKPLQPILWSKEEYDNMKTKKKDLFKYWNFTLNEPAYYECPNAEYPYIRFITDVHPQGYCVPCCKKTLPSTDETNKKAIIHKSCMATHAFTDDISDDSKSRYVSHYGKDLDPGRLSYLPDEVLGPLFYKNNNVADDECQMSREYLMLGVNQLYNNLQLGTLYSASIILQEPTDQILLNVFQYLTDNPHIVNILSIDWAFNNPLELIETLLGEPYSKFKPNTKPLDIIVGGDKNSNVDILSLWNDLILQLISLVYKCRFIVFYIVDNNSTVSIPDTLNVADDFLLDKIGLIIKKQATQDDKIYNYYPIVYADKDLWYKEKRLEVVSFNPKHSIVIDVWDMFKIQLIGKNDTHINLNKLQIVLNKINGEILKYYVNNGNNCYAVLLRYNGNKIYFPVQSSFYAGDKISYTPYKRKGDIKHTLEVFDIYNDHMPKVDITTWLYLNVKGKRKYIGFEAQNMYFYGVTDEADTGHSNAIHKLLYYDPDEINSIIVKKQNTSRDENTQIAFYRKYIYQMIIMEFINLFNNEKNKTMRKKLYSLINLNNLNSKATLQKIEELLVDYPRDLHIVKTLLSHYLDHNNKKLLYQHIVSAEYAFDKILLNNLKKISDHKTLVSRLVLLSKKLFIEKKVDSLKFPNINIACSEGAKANYCSNKKLIIPPGSIVPFMEILASDIQNPLKEKILFSRLFIKSTVDPYKFNNYPYEKIYIKHL